VTAARCPDCGHKAHPETPVECGWCPEGYCEDRAGTAKAENDFAADLDGRPEA
jgi:ribosomal protein S27E